MSLVVDDVILILALVGGPVVVTWATSRLRWLKAVGPVVVCYALGVVIANVPCLEVGHEVAMSASEGAVAFAIPLLLFSLDVKAWLRLARPTILSFSLCAGAVMVSSTLSTVWLAKHLDQPAALAGMMVGVYTGGTPNMAAIGSALRVAPETFVMLNAADLLLCAAFLFFLLGPAARVYGRFLRVAPVNMDMSVTADEARPRYATSLLLAAAVVGTSVALGMVVPEGGREVVTLLALTTLALGLSFAPVVRGLSGSEKLGGFLLLIFCTAMGTLADLERFFSGSLVLVGVVACTLLGATLLHLLLSRAFDLDRDTVIITQTAAIFGPAFVAPVAAALGNREAVLSGVATGLLGYAVGNYLGLGLAWALG